MQIPSRAAPEKQDYCSAHRVVISRISPILISFLSKQFVIVWIEIKDLKMEENEIIVSFNVTEFFMHVDPVQAK